jgi:hypothetical protein
LIANTRALACAEPLAETDAGVVDHASQRPIQLACSATPRISGRFAKSPTTTASASGGCAVRLRRAEHAGVNTTGAPTGEQPGRGEPEPVRRAGDEDARHGSRFIRL